MNLIKNHQHKGHMDTLVKLLEVLYKGVMLPFKGGCITITTTSKTMK